MPTVSISSRQVKLGVFSALLIILLNLYGVFRTSVSLSSGSPVLSGTINMMVFYFLNIYVWVVIRQVLVKRHHQYRIKKLMTLWIGSMGTIVSLLLISILINSKELLGLMVLVSLAAIILFVLLIFRLSQINNAEVATIGYLHNYGIAMIGYLVYTIALQMMQAFMYLGISSDNVVLSILGDVLLLLANFFLLLFLLKEGKVVDKQTL